MAVAPAALARAAQDNLPERREIITANTLTPSLDCHAGKRYTADAAGSLSLAVSVARSDRCWTVRNRKYLTKNE